MTAAVGSLIILMMLKPSYIGQEWLRLQFQISSGENSFVSPLNSTTTYGFLPLSRSLERPVLHIRLNRVSEFSTQESLSSNWSKNINFLVASKELTQGQNDQVSLSKLRLFYAKLRQN